MRSGGNGLRFRVVATRMGDGKDNFSPGRFFALPPGVKRVSSYVKRALYAIGAAECSRLASRPCRKRSPGRGGRRWIPWSGAGIPGKDPDRLGKCPKKGAAGDTTSRTSSCDSRTSFSAFPPVRSADNTPCGTFTAAAFRSGRSNRSGSAGRSGFSWKPPCRSIRSPCNAASTPTSSGPINSPTKPTGASATICGNGRAPGAKSTGLVVKNTSAASRASLCPRKDSRSSRE